MRSLHRRRLSRSGRTFVEQVYALASSLDLHSERGRLVPELLGQSVRELIHGYYRLLYEVRGERVEIVAFIHSRRDFPHAWGR